MIEYRFIYKGILVGYYPAIEDTEKNIIVCQGMPEYISSKHAFISDLLSLGYNVFVPRYYGSWESDGDFSPDTSRDTIAQIIDFVRQGKGVSRYDGSLISWKINSVILLGFSYGATFATELVAKVDFVLLVAPYFPIGNTLMKSIDQEVDFVRKGFKNVYRINIDNMKFKKQFVQNAKISSNNKKISNLTILYGDNDPINNEELIEFLNNISPNVTGLPFGHTLNIGKENYEKFLSQNR